MINLYQILKIPYDATPQSITEALEKYQNQYDAENKIIRATQEWLLVADIRARYDARLRSEQPDFFQAAAPNDSNSEYEYEYAPILWQPKILAMAALLLTPIFGAWFHAVNWRELGYHDLARKNIMMMWAVLGVMLLWLLLMILTGVASGFVAHVLINVAMWAIWFFTLGKKQLDLFENALADSYEPKNWRPVIKWAVLGSLAYFVLTILLLFVAIQSGVAHPSLFE